MGSQFSCIEESARGAHHFDNGNADFRVHQDVLVVNSKKGSILTGNLRSVAAGSFVASPATQEEQASRQGNRKAGNAIPYAVRVLEILHRKWAAKQQGDYTQEPFQHNSEEVKFLMTATRVLCDAVITLCQDQSYPILDLHGSTYVMGELHGHYDILRLFLDQLLNPLDMRFAGCSYLFLGDYVDGGPHSVETILHLFAFKVLHNNQVFLLRGNHELRSVNSNDHLYKDRSFISQCCKVFGRSGEVMHEKFNLAFDQLPVAAVVNHKIFCVHGGIPRVVLDRDVEKLAEYSWSTRFQETGMDSIEQEWFTDFVLGQSAPETHQLEPMKAGFFQGLRGVHTSVFSRGALLQFLSKHELNFLVSCQSSNKQVPRDGSHLVVSCKQTIKDPISTMLIISCVDNKVRFLSIDGALNCGCNER